MYMAFGRSGLGAGKGARQTSIFLGPAAGAMGRVSTGAVGLLAESSFCAAAEGVVMIFGGRELSAGHRIVIWRAVFLAACPAPGSATSSSYVELTRVI
jgi:hypothetical protein